GVIAEATSTAAAKSTSPTSPLLFPACSGVSRFMPTSITTAPGLMKSRSISRARPTAAISTSARAQTSRRSRVREWQTVTVAFSASSSWAIGLPNRLERPTTTASAPSSSTPVSASSSRTPEGVDGGSPGRPSASSPALTGVSPSTSLSGPIRAVRAGPSRCAGTGSCSRMPLTALSAPRLSSSAATSSNEESAGRRRSKGTIPTSRHARCLPPTYTAEAGSSPTSTVARPGARPVSAVKASTSLATSARTRAAIALPSIRVALMAQMLWVGAGKARLRSTSADRRVLGHQLAFRSISREAHHDHAARLHAGDHPVAEGRMHDVLAQTEPHARRRRPLSLSPHARGLSPPARAATAAAVAAGAARARRGGSIPPRGERAGPEDHLLGLLEQVGRDLVEEAAGHAERLRAEDGPAARIGQIQLAHRPRDADVEEPPLLLQGAFVDRARVREDPLLAARDEHDRILEALGVMQSHQRDQTLLLASGVRVGDQRDPLQEDVERPPVLVSPRSCRHVELAAHLHQLLEVLDPSLRLDRALGLERLDVAALGEHRLDELPDRHAGAVRHVAQLLHRVHEAPQRLDRGGAQTRHLIGGGGRVPHRDVDRGRVVGHARERGLPDPPPGRVGHAREAHHVERVGQQLEVGDRVLDLGALVELGAADHLVGDLTAHQRVLDHPRHRIRSIENRDL